MQTPLITKPSTGLVIFSLTLLFYLLFRNTGLHPTVFADEYTYSKLSRLQQLSESTIPGYLYLKLFSYTNQCGDGFLGCAKLINSFLFVSATPFIYLCCRQVASPLQSLTASILATAGPINSYTAYFMPESFYFLGFWVLCWKLLSIKATSSKFAWLTTGFVYGLSALIKPHSLFILPGILIYIGVLFYNNKELISAKSGIAYSSFLFGLALTKGGVSYYFAGPSGLTIFGPSYGSFATSTVSNIDMYFQILQLTSTSLKGQLLALAPIYSLPIALAVLVILYKTPTNSKITKTTPLVLDEIKLASIFSILILTNLIAVVAVFTASVASATPTESPVRLHMRYYNFALPLFFIIIGGVISSKVQFSKSNIYFTAAIVSTFSIYTIATGLAPYTPNHVDSPEIYGLLANTSISHFTAILIILTIVFLLYSQKKGLQVFFYVTLPVIFIFSTSHVNDALKHQLNQDVYHRAGLFIKNFLPKHELENLKIIGSQPGGIYRSLFYIDNKDTLFEFTQHGANYNLDTLPKTVRWVLTFDDSNLVGNDIFQIPLSGFKLTRLQRDLSLDFRSSAWPGLISSVNGLSNPEPWGTWSNSSSVNFEFTHPLPRYFELRITGHPFGPNKDLEFIASTGEDFKRFHFTPKGNSVSILLKNPSASKLLFIKIPKPSSPKNLGLSDDNRELGLGFVKMEIIGLAKQN